MSSKLEGLKIKECPYAFASFAEKHNALVDMLSAMQGQNGITVVMAEKNAIIRGNIANSNGGGAISGNVTQVVTSTGSLANAYYANTDANAYPSAGKWVTANANVTINDTSVSILTGTGKTCTIAFASITQNISIQNIQVCDNGNTKNMLVIGSAPF